MPRAEPSLLGAIRSELKANLRARIGLLLTAVLLIALGLFDFADHVQALGQDYRTAFMKLQRAQALGSEAAWTERAAATARLRQSFERRLWGAGSDGLAAANLSDRVSSAARDAGLDHMQIRIDVARPDGLPADLRRVSATVTAQGSEAGLYRFLDALEGSPEQISVDRLEVLQAPNFRIDATLVAYARVGTTPPGAK